MLMLSKVCAKCKNAFNVSLILETYIYLLPRIATVDTTIRVFQYKLLNNVLFPNKMLY